MSENIQPNFLRNDHTPATVMWYEDRMPVAGQDGNEQYLIIDGQRYEMSQLNTADWLILNAMYPTGPMIVE